MLLDVALRAYFAARGFDANWEAIDEMPDATLVATLAMVCPFEPPEKQALLEAAEIEERTQALLALLQMGAHIDRGRPVRPAAQLSGGMSDQHDRQAAARDPRLPGDQGSAGMGPGRMAS